MVELRSTSKVRPHRTPELGIMDGTVELISRTEDGLYRLPAFIDAQGTLTAICDPFATLSFLALPVIPALKLTDRGLFAQ